MLKHFFKIASRNLLRHKVYSIINITGLAVGMACCLIIMFYVQHELSYDRYHKNADHIYRVVHSFRNTQKGETLPPPAPSEYQVWGCAPIAPALKADFPEIKSIVQFMSPNTLLLQYENKRFQQENLLFMDSTAFDVFSWKLLEGNKQTALRDPNSIVLTKSTAVKYFGNVNPVGKTLKVENDATFVVTGLMEDVPSNSQFTFDGLISMATSRAWRAEVFDWWGYVDFYTYFVLNDHADINAIKSRVPAFLKKYHDNPGYTISFEKLTDAYLRSPATRQPGPTGSLSNVYIFSCIAIFILVIACINFMNLSTARSMERAKEVGVRKALGAYRKSLVRQFLAESIILALIAAIVAIILTYAGYPVIENLAGKTFASQSIVSWNTLLLILVFAMMVGALAGSYPAWFLSRYKPMLVLKGVFNSSEKGIALRKGLVIFQFTLSMVLIAGTGIIFSQLDHLRSHDLGFNKEQMMVIDFGGDRMVQSKIETVKMALAEHPAVISASASRAVPGEFLPNAHTEIQSREGQMISQGPLIYEIDFDFIPQFEIQMVAGRNYSREFPADSSKSMIINEAAARSYGYNNPADAIGKRFSQWGREGTIIGVTRDFNFRSLHMPVEPLTLRYGFPENLNRLTLRLKAGNTQRTINELRTIWDKVSPQRPFLYTFLDESFSKQYEADQYFAQVISLFSGLAIFIACLGLFGLATFTAKQRTKEIGIRKVLGSSVAGIVKLISTDFIRLVVIAIIIAIPFAWWGMNKWLNDFPYRVEVDPFIFVRAALIAVVIAIATISWQSIRAALANPVNSLKDE